MYDPSWPHGHTYNGMKCRVLADDLARPCDGHYIAIAFTLVDGITETVARVTPYELMPIPAPKMKSQAYPPDEVEAAEHAMRAMRRELIAKPLESIWTELAIAGWHAAHAARVKRIWSEN